MRFEYSTDGFHQARKYLKDTNKLDTFEKGHIPVDGYSLIVFANIEFDKLEAVLSERRANYETVH